MSRTKKTPAIGLSKLALNFILTNLQILHFCTLIFSVQKNYLFRINEGKKMSNVLERVKKVIVDQLSVDESQVVETASFTTDLGADSLDTVELVMAFEEEFGIEIPDEEAEKIQTVKDAVDYIESHS